MGDQGEQALRHRLPDGGGQLVAAGCDTAAQRLLNAVGFKKAILGNSDWTPILEMDCNE